MATKEDILEQVVEDYLLHRGYFVRHNDKYRPRDDHSEFNKREDSSRSDIDIIAFNPNLESPENVWVVNCKSWQGGFRPAHWIESIESGKKINGRLAWKSFRELSKDKWAEAFLHEVRKLTGADAFTYVTAVTDLKGERATWENYAPFRKRLAGNPIKVVTFKEMIFDIIPRLDATLAATQVGRLLQLFRAANIDPRQLELGN